VCGLSPPNSGGPNSVVGTEAARLIRVALAKGGALTRSAMVALLRQEEDIDVVAEAGHGAEALVVVGRHRPDVVVLDADLPATDWRSLCPELCRMAPGCQVLMLIDARRSGPMAQTFPSWAPRVGFVVNEAPPGRLVDAIRRMAGGEQFLDPELAVAALVAPDNPFTARELEVLRLAAEGAPVNEIASELCLALGTVRNHWSRIVTKTGARTRIEAIRIAQEAGWL
jgi:two-component system, NarL family, response regulator DesR